jgi:hypothetical protein
MQLNREERQLLSTPGSPARGHTGVLIPVERALNGANDFGLMQVIA